MSAQNKDGEVKQIAFSPATPVTAAPAPAAPVATSEKLAAALNAPNNSETAELLKQLVTVLLLKESRAAKEDNQREIAREAKEKQRAKNAESLTDSNKEKQRNCKHLKGGKGPRTAAIDYSVYIHTYINAERVIRCTLCRAGWKRGDTREYLIRHGRKIENPTGLGWNDAILMLNQTTNRPSSSEVPVLQTPVVGPAGPLPVGATAEII